MRGKIFANWEAVLSFDLDDSETETVHVIPYHLAYLKTRSSQVHDGVDGVERKMARWQILLSGFDIVYVNQKAIKGSVIADFLANRALEDYEPLNFDFPNKNLMYVAITKDAQREDHPWKLNFDGASNVVGNEIMAVLVSSNGDHYPFTSKLDFNCTNNMVEYEACIRAAIERKINVLEVYGDCALVIYQLEGEWETRDPKLISYQKLVLELRSLMTLSSYVTQTQVEVLDTNVSNMGIFIFIPISKF